jgi:lysophospholipase L1-like esterase
VRRPAGTDLRSTEKAAPGLVRGPRARQGGDVQQPRHAGHPRVLRLRRALRTGVLALLAVPPVLAATGVTGVALGPAWRAPTSASSWAPDPAIHAASSAPAPVAPTATTGVRGVVALGDSVPAGSACDCDDYVDLLAQDLGARQQDRVGSTNLAVGGATSADVLAQLDDPRTRGALAGADLVVVTVGANDVESAGDPTTCPGAPRSGGDMDAVVADCYRQQLTDLQEDLGRLLAEVRSLSAAPGGRILVTGYWNVFLDGAAGRAKGRAYVGLADAATRAVDDRIAAAAAAQGATYVDLVTPFHGADGTADATALLAPDGDHPDAQGHAVIARALLSAVR